MGWKPLFPDDLRVDRDSADFDRRQVLSMNYNCQVRFFENDSSAVRRALGAGNSPELQLSKPASFLLSATRATTLEWEVREAVLT
jgi:hypothetical protein